MAEITSHSTILVVEDDPSMLEIIAFLLEDEGYQTLQADSGEAALALLPSNKPDLIISDVMMPGMSGFDLYERIRQHQEWAQIPFVFLTAKGQRADVRRGMGLGADDYLTKPFEPGELITAVKVRLARSAETQAAIDNAATELKGTIVQTLTHEFRTPLALVVGYTDLLQEIGQQMDESAFQTTLHGLHEGAQRLVNLVEDFLLLTRLNSGAMVREIDRQLVETTDPNRAVKEAIDQFVDRAEAKNISLSADLEDRPSSVAIAFRHLLDIVRRLVDNAIKFSEAGGQVIVTTRWDETAWCMEVSDKGIGISHEALSEIFEPFRQVGRQKREQQGAGVGLTIVRGLAEAYGGRVVVESTPQEGTTFTVWLPLIAG
jgi:two-component system sensor histidine kinase/response regulator